MRSQKSAATLCTALLLTTVGPLAADTTHVPLTLPAVSVSRPPDPATPGDPEARFRRAAEGPAALRLITGEQPMLSGEPAALAVKRAQLERTRAAQSARTRELHGLGVDATPIVPSSP